MLLNEKNDRKSDYIIETVEVNGKPKERSVYVGNIMAYDNPKLSVRLKIFLIVVGVYFLASFLGCGFSAFNDNVLYVLIPFILEVIPAALYIMSLVSLCSYGVLVKQSDMGKTVGRIFPVCIIYSALCLCAGVGDVFFVAFDPNFSSLINETAFICCSFLGCLAGVLGAAASKSFAFHEVENPEKKRITLEKQRQNELDALEEMARREEQKKRDKEINDKNKKRRRTITR